MGQNDLPQQQQMAHFVFLKSAAAPQHGRKPDGKIDKVKDKRPKQPAPGH